jgi:hypothetical protein
MFAPPRSQRLSHNGGRLRHYRFFEATGRGGGVSQANARPCEARSAHPWETLAIRPR